MRSESEIREETFNLLRVMFTNVSALRVLLRDFEDWSAHEKNVFVGSAKNLLIMNTFSMVCLHYCAILGLDHWSSKKVGTTLQRLHYIPKEKIEELRNCDLSKIISTYRHKLYAHKQMDVKKKDKYFIFLPSFNFYNTLPRYELLSLIDQKISIMVQYLLFYGRVCPDYFQDLFKEIQSHGVAKHMVDLIKEYVPINERHLVQDGKNLGSVMAEVRSYRTMADRDDLNPEFKSMLREFEKKFVMTLKTEEHSDDIAQENTTEEE